MKNEIVLKLNRHLASGIQNEAEVQYTLTQVRKLFEVVPPTDSYPVLAFYCDWVLHARLDRQHWAKNGLQILEAAVTGFESGNGPSEGVLRAVNSVLSFQQLHSELLKFGKEFGVAFDQLSYETWRAFGASLIDILIGCPLEATSSGAVRRLALTRDFTFMHVGGQTLAFWKIDLQDGRSMFGPIF